MGAAMIVCFHTPHAPATEITVLGLTYFVLLTFCLQAMSGQRGRSFPWKDRAHRLLLPWLVWSLVYSLPQLIKHRPLLAEVARNPNVLLIGSEAHLWFLPFAFLGSVAAYWVSPLNWQSRSRIKLFGCAVGALALAAIPLTLGRTPQAPWTGWLYGAPLVPIGLAIGMAQKLSQPRLIQHYGVIVAVAFAMTLMLGASSYLFGILTLAISILPRSRDWPVLRWVAGLSMGIYLMHPCFFLVGYKYFPHAPWYIFAVFGLVGSTAVSAVIALIPPLNSVMFGAVRRTRRPLTPPLAEASSESIEGVVVSRNPLDLRFRFSQ